MFYISPSLPPLHSPVSFRITFSAPSSALSSFCLSIYCSRFNLRRVCGLVQLSRSFDRRDSPLNRSDGLTRNRRRPHTTTTTSAYIKHRATPTSNWVDFARPLLLGDSETVPQTSHSILSSISRQVKAAAAAAADRGFDDDV